MSKRLINILINGARTFILPVSTFVISFIIIKTYDVYLWGEFVSEMLFINLTAHILQWGNKEFLIREYSQSPSTISQRFYSSLATRSLLLLPVIILLFFISDSIPKALLLSGWLIGQYIYQSSESVIIYSQTFLKQLYLELISFALILTGIFVLPNLGIFELIILFSSATLLKAAGICLLTFPKLSGFSINTETFSKALPFLIIGLSGLLQSRIDQYIIALFENKSITGIYQIFLSSFILLQSISAVIIIPFNKILYRVNEKTFDRLMKKMLLLSIATVIPLGIFTSVILVFIFGFSIQIYYLISGIVFAFPPFIYVPIIYQMYRVNKEKEVVIVNYLGAILNLIITFIFVFKGMPMAAIIGGAIAQWSMLIWYLKRKKAILHEIKMSGMSTST